MKKLFTFVCAALCTTAMSAAQYCHELLTSGDKSIYLTCEKLSEGSYQLTVEGENLNGFGGSFFNPGAVDLRSTITSSTAEKIVCSIAAESDPQLYTPLYVMMPGEVNFAWPNDVEWGTCGEQVEDNVKPVMGTASLASVTYNAAVINVAGTDKTTADGEETAVTRFRVQYGDKTLTLSAAEGQITVKDLTAGTAYSFTIFAQDNAGNVSDNSVKVDATTESLTYCDFPTGHQGNAEFGDPEGRILLTISNPNGNVVRVTVKPNKANGATKNLDYLRVYAPGSQKEDFIYEAGKQSANEADGKASLSVDITYATMPERIDLLEIKWSQPAWDGEWAMNVTQLSPLSFCKDGTTALSEAETDTKATKVIRNGQLVIVRDGVEYNVLGNKLQ